MVKSEHVNNNNGNDKANEVQAVREQEVAEPPTSAQGWRPSFENDVHMSDDDLLQRKRQINRILDNSENSSSSSHPMQETSTSLPSATAGSTRAGQAVNALEEMDRAVAQKYLTASSSSSAVLGARSTSHLQHLLDFEETHREIAEKIVSEELGNRQDGGNPTDDRGAPPISLVPGAYAVSGIGSGADKSATMEAENLLWDLMNHHVGAADDNDTTDYAMPEIPVAQEPGDNHDGLVTAHPVMTEHDDEGPAQFALPADNSTTTKRGLKKKHLWFIGFFVVSLVTVSVVGGVCGTGYCNDDTDTNDMPSVAPTSSRYMLIQDFQQEIEAVLGADYFEEAHPLFALRDQALHWIVNSDPLQLDVEATNLLQRFILTVFQYQTSQEKEWAACHPQEGGIDTCYHAGTDQIAIRWLSQTHECQWAGIRCASEMEDDMNITEVDLSSMALSGGLPTELFQLSNLNKLLLLRNSITGTIPTEISNLSYLTWLNFGENLLTGGLPSQIMQLSQLEKLLIRQNSISGSIPGDLFSHPALVDFVLHDNSLTGRLPVPAQPQTIMGVFFLENNAVRSKYDTKSLFTSLCILTVLSVNWYDPNRICLPIIFECLIS